MHGRSNNLSPSHRLQVEVKIAPFPLFQKAPLGQEILARRL